MAFNIELEKWCEYLKRREWFCDGRKVGLDMFLVNLCLFVFFFFLSAHSVYMNAFLYNYKMGILLKSVHILFNV